MTVIISWEFTQAAVRFGITESNAEKYAGEIIKTVQENWMRIASGYGLNRRQIEEMRPAFSICPD